MKKEFYRNTYDLVDANNEHVDRGSLFERTENTLILVDEDRFVEFPFNEEDFEFAFVEDQELEK